MGRLGILLSMRKLEIQRQHDKNFTTIDFLHVTAHYRHRWHTTTHICYKILYNNNDDDDERSNDVFLDYANVMHKVVYNLLSRKLWLCYKIL